MKVVTEGVYFLFDKGVLVYVGETDNLFRRIGQHIAEGKKQFDSFEIYPCADRKRLEGFLIRTLSPKYNVSSGAWYDFDGTDIFPTQDVQDTIDLFNDKHGGMTVRAVADKFFAYPGKTLKALKDIGAPIYKINGIWKIDERWVYENDDKISKAM